LTAQLTVRVNDELQLQVGHVAEVSDGGVRQRVITPPAATMFEQLLSYLDAKPLPKKSHLVPTTGQEGVAAAAVCLRWGSYFAVLADQTKPLWNNARDNGLRKDTSRISDSEMARINIEASAAMADWVDIFRSDMDGRYSVLVAKALAWLPMPQRKVAASRGNVFHGLTLPEVRQQLAASLQPARKAAVMAQLETHGSRVLGNALVNYGWRNGPIENVHAGRCATDLPLHQCRIPAAELRDLMRHTAACFQSGMEACLEMSHENPWVAWPEQVLPFSQAEILLVTPSGWTLTEKSREVREFLPDGSLSLEEPPGQPF
jgi:hypothetical protein